jgi:glycosyltransferase involved in cell wall biosynthesis
MDLAAGGARELPRCSVLIPAFNVERYIATAIESALGQTFTDYEIVVVNDGSTDGTLAQIEPFMNRIVYVEQPNLGVAAARNAGVERATGEFIADLDSDDYWPPNRLERMVEYLDAYPTVALATSDSYLVYEHKETEDRTYRTLPRRWGFRAENQAYWITQYNFMNRTIARTQAFQRHGTFDQSLRTCEDWDFYLRALNGGERAGLVDEPLAYRRLRKTSLTIDSFNILSDQIQMLEKFLRDHPRAPGVTGRIRYAEAKRALAEGNHRDAAKLFSRAAADPHLHLPMRWKARIAATAPRLSWAGYLKEVNRRGRR